MVARTRGEVVAKTATSVWRPSGPACGRDVRGAAAWEGGRLGEGPMKVNELAEELDQPASAVLEQCQRFGIDATWAGADLDRADVVVLRAELAAEEPAVEDPTADDAAILPVGEDADPDAKKTSDGGFSFAGFAASGGGSAAAEPERTNDEAPPTKARKRRFDPGLRPSAITLGVSALLFVGANRWLHNPWPIAALCLAATVALLFGTLRAGQARYRASIHPERVAGTVIATVLVGLGLVAIVVVGLVAWTIVRDEPADDAPLALGRPAAVTQLRWGWGRLTLTAGNSWDPVAKDPGSCWSDPTDPTVKAKAPRRKDRVELGQNSVSCFRPHTFEVIDRWSVDHVRDSPYPEVAAFQVLASARCGPELDRLNQAPGEAPAGATLGIEYPNAEAWARGDHDLTCVAQTASRTTRLTD